MHITESLPGDGLFRDFDLLDLRSFTQPFGLRANQNDGGASDGCLALVLPGSQTHAGQGGNDPAHGRQQFHTSAPVHGLDAFLSGTTGRRPSVAEFAKRNMLTRSLKSPLGLAS